MAVLAAHGEKLPGIQRVTSAGAPVPADVVSRMRELLPEAARFWTPYGATECLPVAVIEGRELELTREASEQGAGTCVGRPVAPNVVRIIGISDGPLPRWQDGLEISQGAIGEITVAGPSATDEYFRRPEATALAKIHERLNDGSERIVHRMGDLGWFDEQGRLWFCGRKTQRVRTEAGSLFTEQVEPVFNVHPKVRRTALVGVGEPGKQRAVLCVEMLPGVSQEEGAQVLEQLRHLGLGYVHTARVSDFLRHPAFPVDIRHNAKIGREILARWAGKQLRAKR
jgi:acyl-CoA synthetase (AMP-forming)/AMP-acid ligase II